jgi:hypothetical protein
VFVPISSTKTSRPGSTCSATITLQAALSHSSRSGAPTVRFLGEAKPLHQPPYGRVAHIRSRYVLQKAASFADGGARALLYVLFEKGSGFLVRLAGSSGALSWREGVSLSDPPSVSLDRGEAHVEGAGRLSFGHASLYGGDYLLLAEVFGVGSHPPMLTRMRVKLYAHC